MFLLMQGVEGMLQKLRGKVEEGHCTNPDQKTFYHSAIHAFEVGQDFWVNKVVTVVAVMIGEGKHFQLLSFVSVKKCVICMLGDS